MRGLFLDIVAWLGAAVVIGILAAILVVVWLTVYSLATAF